MKVCKKCKVETECNAAGGCKVCANELARNWRINNPEKTKANRDAWRSANPNRIKSFGKSYYVKNKDKLNTESAIYRAANAEKIKITKAIYNAANPNYEAKRINNQNRRARKRSAGGFLSKGLAVKLFKLQRGKCACCKEPLGTNYHLDHIMPLARGGSNTDENIQLLRRRCNHQKNAKDPIQYMQSKGFLL